MADLTQLKQLDAGDQEPPVTDYGNHAGTLTVQMMDHFPHPGVVAMSVVFASADGEIKNIRGRIDVKAATEEAAIGKLPPESTLVGTFNVKSQIAKDGVHTNVYFKPVSKVTLHPATVLDVGANEKPPTVG